MDIFRNYRANRLNTEQGARSAMRNVRGVDGALIRAANAMAIPLVGQEQSSK